MKLTTKQLKQIIKEEMGQIVLENQPLGTNEDLIEKIISGLLSRAVNKLAAALGNNVKNLSGNIHKSGANIGLRTITTTDKQLSSVVEIEIDDLVYKVTEKYVDNVYKDMFESWDQWDEIMRIIEQHPLVNEFMQQAESMKQFAKKMIQAKTNPNITTTEKQLLDLINSGEFNQAYELGDLL